MNERENVQLVQELYVAFGRGDVPVLLAQLTDDVAWYDPGPPEVPQARRYSGREGVGRFFARTDETLEIDEWRRPSSRPGRSGRRPRLPPRARQGDRPLV